MSRHLSSWTQHARPSAGSSTRASLPRRLRSLHLRAEGNVSPIQALILRRDTHIDPLLKRLREERVWRVVEPLGAVHAVDMLSDDVRYCVDLGLLRAFQHFWRANADVWTTKYDYREAAPLLILMAFLQRVVNGGAHLVREFAAGRRRLDLDLIHAGRHYPIESKLHYGPKTRSDGEAQLADSGRTLRATDGWLIIFDRRGDRTWDERITWDAVEHDGLHLRVIGC